MRENQVEHPTRRQALLTGGAAVGAVGAVGLTAAAIAGATSSGSASSSHSPAQPKSGASDDIRNTAPSGRMPVVYLPHGGGPWPFVDLGFPKAELAPLSEYLSSLSSLPKTPPSAVLVVSAHWEESVPTVMSAAKPPMLYDYYGFPPESYRITWPAPGNPQLATRVREALGAAGFATAEDTQRGFDHGTFVPLKLMYPTAEIPTVQLSLKTGLDPREHIAMGKALSPLRDQGVFIVGSGMSFHNMRAFRDGSRSPEAALFDDWLKVAVTQGASERNAQLADWTKAPGARYSHPREEHLLPLMVMAGAAGDDRGQHAFSGTSFGLPISAFHFA